MLSTRFMDLLVYAALSVLAIVIIRALSDMPVTLPGDVGTHFFPTVLAWGVLALSGLGALRSVLSGPGKTFHVPYLSRIVVTVVMLAVFFFSWSTFGAFYVQAFVFLFLLFSYYRVPVGISVRLVAINFAVALGITLFCYVVFNFLIYVDL